MEVLHPIAVPPPPDQHNSDCPFCNEDPPPKKKKSKIGKDNSSKKLEDNLAAEGEPRSDLSFYHDDYGNYSGEPHHLVCGNEALKDHPIENWLSTKDGTFVNADTGFDINSDRNGIWLPSIPDANRICKWESYKVKINGEIKNKRRPARSEKGKKMWSTFNDDEKDEIAFAIMRQERRQFHKSNHRNKGEKPTECYIKEVERLLNGIEEYVGGVLIHCPEAEEDDDSKYPPPYGLNDLIYAVASGHMRWHVVGSPESWFVFISELARRLYQQEIDEGASPWEAPYEDHPNHN